jgi:hypothetical protein
MILAAAVPAPWKLVVLAVYNILELGSEFGGFFAFAEYVLAVSSIFAPLADLACHLVYVFQPREGIGAPGTLVTAVIFTTASALVGIRYLQGGAGRALMTL